MADIELQQPALVPVGKPVSLIPVGLKEAALDSPTFRATAVHFADQIDIVERWLDSYVRAASRITQEASVLEGQIQQMLANSSPPLLLSEAVLDHDYTTLAMQRLADGARDFWTHVVGGMKKTQLSVVEPVRSFLSHDTKAFKDARRSLESTQKTYDGLLARYYGQIKTKEPSSLREDAFQLHEARRAYLKASMDFSVLAPQLSATLNILLIRVFSEQWLDFKDIREASTIPFTKHLKEITRIRDWSKETAQGEKFSKFELLSTRKEIEAAAINAAQPPRELDYYSSTVSSFGSRPPAFTAPSSSSAPSNKQGWLFLRTITGKPSRTIWIRRWFFVNNGIFGSLIQGVRSGGVEESEKIGVLLCSVRAALQEERRFCFEVKTKDTTILLQAESQSELTQWIEVFEVAKQRAMDEPAIGDPLASGGNPASDAAFAVSPAVAPELAARRADGQVANIAEEVQSSSHLSESDAGPSLTSRHSIDVSKRPDRVEGERNRDHAARLIQKLDIHRKTSSGAQLSTSPTISQPATPGIASLISASHAALPVGPTRTEALPSTEKTEGTSSSHPSNRLAPSHLANPPAPTNLSKTAVIVGAERGVDLGVVDSRGGVPSSIMANQWGTTNYGHLSRIERGEVKPSEKSAERSGSLSTSNTPLLSGQSGPALPESLEPLVQGGTASQISSDNVTGRARSASVLDHRKSPSDTDTVLQPQRRLQSGRADFPSFYPQDMRAHDSQFRMLFPNVPQDERVVLVFRASWNPEDRQDLPGRIFVTLNQIYFYSNHYGFVVVSGVTLSTILSVSSSRLEDHDVLHLRVYTRSGSDDTTFVTIKTFLGSVKLLERRLNYLAANCSAEEPDGLQEVLEKLLELEVEPENASYESVDDVFAVEERTNNRAETSLKVDRSLNYGGDQMVAADSHDPMKFRLPTQPVVYKPKHMDDVAAEGDFNVSAKALFHIMFGDKSVLSHMLYRERRSEAVKQFPWTRDDEGRWTRRFEYDVDALDALRRVQQVSIVDLQVVDLANDHLCYVITDVKTPWHLPSARDFSMVTKVVITHTAKSKSNLRIFTKVEWKGSPALYSTLIRRHAIDDLRHDGQDLLDLVSDQVQKLGPDCTTKKAIQIFGNIGHQNEGAVITSAEPSILGKKRPVRVMIRHRGLFSLMLETMGSFAASAVSTILMSIIGIVKAIFGLFSAHTLLLLFLLGSISVHLLSSTQVASNWWRDQNAAYFMSRIGVGPNAAMSRTIYLSDLEDLVSFQHESYGQADSKCSTAFQTILAHTDPDSLTDESLTMFGESSTRSTTRRLRRTRQRMGSYRHELTVALRLINGMERETVQAEYENWLIEETAKCREIGAVLQGASAEKGNDVPVETPAALSSMRNSSRSERLAANIGADNVEHVQGWYDDYCRSCYSAHEAVTAGFSGTARK